jgi:hypothetical protein
MPSFAAKTTVVFEPAPHRQAGEVMDPKIGADAA